MTVSTIPAAPGTFAVVRGETSSPTYLPVIAWIVDEFEDENDLQDAAVYAVGTQGVIRNVSRFVLPGSHE